MQTRIHGKNEESIEKDNGARIKGGRARAGADAGKVDSGNWRMKDSNSTRCGGGEIMFRLQVGARFALANVELFE